MQNSSHKTIAILGGTGALGTGLAQRWLRAGYAVIIGSRNSAKAEASVKAMHQVLPATKLPSSALLTAADNVQAARDCDIAVLTVPFAHQKTTLQDLRASLEHKILIDATVPLLPPKVDRVQLPAEGSAALIAQAHVASTTTVVSAFHNVAAAKLASVADLDCDVLVCSDDEAAASLVVTLVQQAGMRGWYAGALANSAACEALTSVLIFLNKRHRAQSGIRITGIDQ